MLLLSLDSGSGPLQCPKGWQVNELTPNIVYPELHVKETTVPTGLLLPVVTFVL